MSEAIEAEKEAKRQLAQRVAYLEAELGPDHAVREAELERLLQQVICSWKGRRLELKENKPPASPIWNKLYIEWICIYLR